MKTYVSSSFEETKKIAAEFAHKLKGGELIALVGDLGSGKTTFVRGMAEALGATAPVKSPTFTLMNIYTTADARVKRLVHLDFYRLGSQSEAFGLEEERRPDTVVCVEWPQEDETQKPSWTVLFEHGATMNERVITLQQHGILPRQT